LLYGVFIAGLIGFFILAGVLAMVTVGRSNASFHTVGAFAGALIVGLLVLFAGLFNIVVKRGRDIGVRGYVAGIGFLLVFVVGGAGIFLSIALAFVPSDAVARFRA
jgi:hypothetical protein